MSKKPVTLRYRGWVIQCTPEQIAGGWCALVEVLRPNGRKAVDAVPFSQVVAERDEAGVEGLVAGKRWIDSQYHLRRSSYHRARIEVLLLQYRPDALCVHCIASTLAIGDEAVQRAAAFLDGMPGYARQNMTCAKCAKQRLTVRAT